MESVFLNGEFVPREKAKIPVWDRGVLYGDGFFTTMRAEEGRVFFLKEHLERLKASCKLFKIRFPDTLENPSLYKELLKLNGLSSGTAAVKILITRGVAEGLGLPQEDDPTYAVFARSYTPPYEAYKSGWKLITFPIPRTTPVAGHKSLNFLYNLWARDYAIERGGDEAILVGPDGFVRETSVGTLVFKDEGRIVVSQGEDILPGVTVKVLSKIWKEKGFLVEKRRVAFEELSFFKNTFVLNSLVGVVPVARVDGKKMGLDAEFAESSRRWLWECT